MRFGSVSSDSLEARTDSVERCVGNCKTLHYRHLCTRKDNSDDPCVKTGEMRQSDC